jgi:hypothetical protein
MPRLITAAADAPPAIGYAFTIHQLFLSELATNHFISTIIDNDTGAVLEYCKLQNKIECLFQGIQEQKGTNKCFCNGLSAPIGSIIKLA